MTAISATAIFLSISVVALLGARIHLNSKAKRFEENKKAAWISLQTGSTDLPSWIRNEQRLSEFLLVVQRMASREGVPSRKILEELSTEHVFIKFICFAGALELRNATFAEQQLAVAETISQRFAYDKRMRTEAEVFFSN